MSRCHAENDHRSLYRRLAVDVDAQRRRSTLGASRSPMVATCVVGNLSKVARSPAGMFIHLASFSAGVARRRGRIRANVVTSSAPATPRPRYQNRLVRSPTALFECRRQFAARRPVAARCLRRKPRSTGEAASARWPRRMPSVVTPISRCGVTPAASERRGTQRRFGGGFEASSAAMPLLAQQAVAWARAQPAANEYRRVEAVPRSWCSHREVAVLAEFS